MSMPPHPTSVTQRWERDHHQVQHFCRTLRAVRPRHDESLNWWYRLSTIHPDSLFLNWRINRGGYKRSTGMHSKETNNSSWYCFNGKVPSLQPRQ